MMLLKLMQIHIPMFVRKEVLCALFELSADAFKCHMPELKGLSYRELLKSYARFTNDQAQKLLNGGDGIEDAKERLYQAAFSMGSELRHRLHIKRFDDVMAASQMMYRILGIDMHQELGGIIIDKCFFSQYYSCDVCRVVSALDEGVEAGLSGGGRLEFYHRITEGNSCCRARFELRGGTTMKKAIIIGSGAGGATAAKELQGRFDVTVLEAGKAFKPFSMRLSVAEKLKRTGLFLDEREIQLLFPAMKIRKTPDRMVLVNGIGLGGTTTLSAGNALRMDGDLQKLGIDLDSEFEEIYKEIPVTTDHKKNWRDMTNRLFDICVDMGLKPQPTPKLGDYSRCTNCGQCVLGCKFGVKWDSRVYLDEATDNGAKVLTGCKVDRVIIENKRATGVVAQLGLRKKFFPADLIIVAAGGLTTPIILQNSGVECQNSLFVDPVLCVAAECRDSLQNKEITMPFVVQKDHFILSPYFDHLSFYFNKDWKYPARDTLSLMIKLKDVNCGGIDSRNITKVLTDKDKERLREGVELCTQMHRRLGIKKEDVFLGTLNAGHPGGMLPLTANEADTFHNSRLPENLYVADATLFPASLGNPPILTIIAMAKRVCKICVQNA